jgi:dTDP-4-dehydrorhamnose 3,5-epimerase
MKVTSTRLDGALIIEPDVFRDERGYFLESYHHQRYEDAGIRGVFVQDNRSRSPQGILRGLHAQLRYPQGKLISVVEGEIFDVGVDIRPGSKTYGQWVSVVLSASNLKQFYVPPGFAHGFYVLSETAIVEYKCTNIYRPEDEITLCWNDPHVGIVWPSSNPVLSKKDKNGQTWDELDLRLKQ